MTVMAFTMLTTSEAGALLNVSAATVSQRIRDGALPATRRSGHWFIKRSAVEAYIRANGLPAPRSIREPTVLGPQLVARALLELEGEPATPDELALLVGRHPGNVRKFLLLLRASGHAERGESGWLLTQAGDAAYRAEVAA